MHQNELNPRARRGRCALVRCLVAAGGAQKGAQEQAGSLGELRACRGSSRDNNLTPQTDAFEGGKTPRQKGAAKVVIPAPKTLSSTLLFCHQLHSWLADRRGWAHGVSPGQSVSHGRELHSSRGRTLPPGRSRVATNDACNRPGFPKIICSPSRLNFSRFPRVSQKV